MSKSNSIMCPIHSTTCSRVLLQDVSHFFVGGPPFSRGLTLVHNYILYTLALLRASMFFELGRCCRHKLLRYLCFFHWLQLFRYAFRFGFRLLRRNSFELFAHAAIYFCLPQASARRTLRRTRSPSLASLLQKPFADALGLRVGDF